MTYLRMGNLSPEQFAERVGTSFTDEELEYLHLAWSQQAALQNGFDFHIFDDPSISVTVGSSTGRVLEIFTAANARQPFNRSVPFDLDKRHYNRPHICHPLCRHECGECRLGLGKHVTCDPRCELHDPNTRFVKETP